MRRLFWLVAAVVLVDTKFVSTQQTVVRLVPS
jgi:hypothetical protein